MPTDLERRLLSTLIHDLDIHQLRRLVMRVAETHLELVGTEALRIKEDQPRTKVDRQVASVAMTPRINTPARGLELSESPAIESDLESHTRSDDELQDDDYVPPTITTPAPSATRPAIRPIIPIPRPLVRLPGSLARHTSIQTPKTKSARLNRLLHGLRTLSQRKSLERIAGIIDTFNWKTGTRTDFLNQYIGHDEYLASGWPAMVNAHGKRLRRYSEGFRGMYPPKKRKLRDTIGPSGVDVKMEE